MSIQSMLSASTAMYQIQSMQSLRFQTQRPVLNPWRSMVPNYAQMNDRILGRVLFDKYSRMNDQIDALAAYERESKAFDSEFDSVFGELKASSSALKPYSGDSVFHPIGYGSSNSDVATVTENTAAVTAPIHLEVTQTAASTSYASRALSSEGNSLQGRHTLNITGSDGTVTSIHVEFDSTEDNKTNLNRMAAAINERNLGITASVSESDGKSTLVFTADKTGTEHAFTAELSGESSARVGLEQKRQARDSKYTVDGGEEQVSQSNEIKLLDGDLGVTLRGTGSTDIAHRTVDDAQTVEAVKKFADSYNKVLSFLGKYKDKSSSLNSMAYSYGLTRLMSGTLSHIGINVDGKGALSVDEVRLKDALRNTREDVEKVLGRSVNPYARTESILIKRQAHSFYPKPQSLSDSNYMYGRNRKYVSPNIHGMFFSYLV